MINPFYPTEDLAHRSIKSAWYRVAPLACVLIALSSAACGEDDDGGSEETADSGADASVDPIEPADCFLSAPCENVVYVETPEPNTERQIMDIYMPDGDGPFPAVVFVHGGGFLDGSKDEGTELAASVVPAGYVFVTMNYRLSGGANGDAVFPDAVHDTKAAIRFLRANAETYRIDPDKLVAWGSSAGGNLASMLGTTAGIAELEGDLGHGSFSLDVQAVVDWYGNTDLVGGADSGEEPPNAWLTPYIGLPYNPDDPSSVDAYAYASPITHVTADDAAFLIQHGTSDTSVSMGQSERFANALESALGADPVVFETFADYTHNDPRFRDVENLDRIIEFLDSHLRN